MAKNVVKTDVSERKNKARDVRIIIGLVLIVAAVAIVVYVIFSFVAAKKGDETVALFESEHVSDDENAQSYEDVLSTYYTAILDGDGKAMVNIMAPPDYWTYYLDAYDKSEADVIASFEEMCTGVLSNLESAYGAPISLSYQILGASEPDEAGIEEWDEQMETIISGGAMDILDAVTLEVALTVTGGESSDVLTYYPTIVQIGDGWYMLSDDSDELQGNT